MKIGYVIYETDCQLNTTTPNWTPAENPKAKDEIFKFQFVDYTNEKEPLVISVLDDDYTGEQLMGFAKIKLEDLHKDEQGDVSKGFAKTDVHQIPSRDSSAGDGLLGDQRRGGCRGVLLTRR